MSVAHTYDTTAYSDLGIKLGDGRTVHVHKLILCTRNEYFRKLCGFNSVFATFEDSRTNNDWCLILNVHKIADKYLEKDLSRAAAGSFVAVARKVEDADEILDIITALSSGLPPDSRLRNVAAFLEKENLLKFLRNERWRATQDEVTLWKHVDSLLPKPPKRPYLPRAVGPNGHTPPHMMGVIHTEDAHVLVGILNCSNETARDYLRVHKSFGAAFNALYEQEDISQEDGLLNWSLAPLGQDPDEATRSDW